MRRTACLILALAACDTGPDPMPRDTEEGVSTSDGSEPSTVMEPTTSTSGGSSSEGSTGEPSCGGALPGECKPSQPTWCLEVEAFCRDSEIGEGSSLVDFCDSVGDWCVFGAVPCDMCAALEQQCIDELKTGESVDDCIGVVSACMCLGISHGVMF